MMAKKQIIHYLLLVYIISVHPIFINATEVKMKCPTTYNKAIIAGGALCMVAIGVGGYVYWKKNAKVKKEANKLAEDVKKPLVIQPTADKASLGSVPLSPSKGQVANPGQWASSGSAFSCLENQASYRSPSSLKSPSSISALLNESAKNDRVIGKDGNVPSSPLSMPVSLPAAQGMGLDFSPVASANTSPQNQTSGSRAASAVFLSSSGVSKYVSFNAPVTNSSPPKDISSSSQDASQISGSLSSASVVNSIAPLSQPLSGSDSLTSPFFSSKGTPFEIISEEPRDQSSSSSSLIRAVRNVTIKSKISSDKLPKSYDVKLWGFSKKGTSIPKKFEIFINEHSIEKFIKGQFQGCKEIKHFAFESDTFTLRFTFKFHNSFGKDVKGWKEIVYKLKEDINNLEIDFNWDDPADVQAIIRQAQVISIKGDPGTAHLPEVIKRLASREKL
jgi:hypothetical protein